jgi:phosphatidylglycerol:prolipoprotein diacylglycerol transferase
MRPVLFHIGSFPVRSFGVMVLAGFLLALWYAMTVVRREMKGRDPKEKGLLTPDHIFDFGLVALFVCILGARLLYISLHWSEFSGSPGDVLKIWTGGISVHGAIIAGAFYCWWYARRHGLSPGKLADLGGPSFALGYFVGRLGCFLNGCCYGSECNLPWAVRFHVDGKPGVLTPPSHPAQVYESLMALVVFGILHFWRKRPHRDGEIILGFFGLYLVIRFIDELFRRGATADLLIPSLGLTHSMTFSLVMLPVVLFFLLRLRRKPLPPAQGETLTEAKAASS